MATNNHVGISLEEECDRLKKTVEELRRAQVQDRETIRALTEERDQYLRALYAWSRSQVSEDRLEEWARDTQMGESFDEMLAELRASKAP